MTISEVQSHRRQWCGVLNMPGTNLSVEFDVPEHRAEILGCIGHLAAGSVQPERSGVKLGHNWGRPGSNPFLWRLRRVIRSDSGMILLRVGQPGWICAKHRRRGVLRLLAPAPFSESKEFPDAGLVGRVISSAALGRADIPVCRFVWLAIPGMPANRRQSGVMLKFRSGVSRRLRDAGAVGLHIWARRGRSVVESEPVETPWCYSSRRRGDFDTSG